MRQYWKASNLLNPLPAVLVSCRDKDGNCNVMTAAWAGTVCSDPVMVSVSIKKSRYSHHMIKETMEFVLNLTNEDLLEYTDYVGIYSGKKVDKFNLAGNLKVTKIDSKEVKAPTIMESPLSLECKVKQVLELGSHDMFVGEVVAVSVDDKYLDKNGGLDLTKAHLIAYSHGSYYALGKQLAKFSFSSKKPQRKRRRNDELKSTRS